MLILMANKSIDNHLMKTMYVISTKYHPVVSVNLSSLCTSSRVSVHSVSQQKLHTTFRDSITDELIACDNKDDALLIMRCLLKKHNAHIDFIPQELLYIAVPVVYAVRVNEKKLSVKKQLSANLLVNYADDTTLIPYEALSDDEGLFSTKKMRADKRRAEKKRIHSLLTYHGKAIDIHMLSSLNEEDASDAYLLGADGDRVECVDLRQPSQHLSWVEFFRQRLVPKNEVESSMSIARFFIS